MRRGILIVLLAAGAAFGFTLGFGRLYAWHHYGHGWGHGFHGRSGLEERAADACVRAAERVLSERGKAAAPAPAP
ncbi:MAG TPA: hypothetical protein VGK73_10985 [Polyangiaceae bacterium]